MQRVRRLLGRSGRASASLAAEQPVTTRPRYVAASMSARSSRKLLPARARAASTGSSEYHSDFGGMTRLEHLYKTHASLGTFQERCLLEGEVSFSSQKGRQLFTEALDNGYMENYFFLSEQFHTQSESTSGGRASLAMVLNSLRIDPMRTWKGAWRWFSEQNLCCGDDAEPSRGRAESLTFNMFECMARCNGAHVMAHRSPDEADNGDASRAFTDLFRDTVRASSRTSEREFIVVCYSGPVVGPGNFVPIGGYHEETDSVLLMDVKRFADPLHWAPLRDVVGAMGRTDPSTGKPNGYLHLRTRPPVSERSHIPKPLAIPHVPKAAGKRLSRALLESLASFSSPVPRSSVPMLPRLWATRAMCRWLQAASNAEPQVLRSIFQVPNAEAFTDVLKNLKHLSLFSELCCAYGKLLGLGLMKDFPPLRFTNLDSATSRGGMGEGIGLETCGELWVLLLLLLPQHIRAQIASELGEPSVSEDVIKAVRCPWALPLEALRESLKSTLLCPEAQESVCEHRPAKRRSAEPGRLRRLSLRRQRSAKALLRRGIRRTRRQGTKGELELSQSGGGPRPLLAPTVLSQTPLVPLVARRQVVVGVADSVRASL